MIDNLEIIEPPDEIEPVTRPEAKGMWRQLDTLRIAQQSAADDISEIKTKLSGLASGLRGDIKWFKALLFLLLLERVAVHVLATAPAQAMVAMVSP